MGTSKSYSGSGGKAGKAIRDDVEEWIGTLPSDDRPESAEPQAGEGDNDAETPPPLQRPFVNVIALLHPRSRGGDGPGAGGGAGGAGAGGGRSSGGPQRSVGRSAATAGRAAAAAYAFSTGDAAALESMGLSYAELSALGSPIQVARRIVEMVCGPRGDSTIDDTEQRLIAADVAEWVISQQGEGYEATPEDIAKHAIANILADTLLTESGELVSNSSASVAAEEEIRQAAENWVETHASIEIEGATEEAFTRSIEQGIETLRRIFRGKS